MNYVKGFVAGLVVGLCGAVVGVLYLNRTGQLAEVIVDIDSRLIELEDKAKDAVGSAEEQFDRVKEICCAKKAELSDSPEPAEA